MDLDEQLIEEVRKHRLLYDLEHQAYKNIKLKDRAWKEISETIHLDETKCKKRWRGLRDCYKRCKRNELLPSGSGAVAPRKQWKYYDGMSFLDQVKSYRSTCGNIEADDCIILDDLVMEEDECEATMDSSYSEQTCTSETPNKSKRARKESEVSSFNDFLAVASECIKQTTSSFVARSNDQDSTALLFSCLALQIKNSKIPPIAVSQLNQKISTLVFEEIQKYEDCN